MQNLLVEAESTAKVVNSFVNTISRPQNVLIAIATGATQTPCVNTVTQKIVVVYGRFISTHLLGP